MTDASVKILDHGYATMPPDEIAVEVEFKGRRYSGCLTEDE
jgi:hypothetical protein